MNINDIPDDCLIVIFSYFDDLENLFTFYNVCSRWQNLVELQLRKYELLIGTDQEKIPPDLIQSDYRDLKSIVVHTEAPMKQLFHLMPNIKYVLLDFDEWDDNGRKELIKLRAYIGNHCNQIKGFCDTDNGSTSLSEDIIRRLEMHVDNGENLYKTMKTFKRKGITATWRQLFCVPPRDLLYFDILVNQSPKLERLNFSGPINADIANLRCENFKIFECDFQVSQVKAKNEAFQFIEMCPKLESVFLRISSNIEYGDLNEKVQNTNLKDLVIEGRDSFWAGATVKVDSMAILRKFPNLKHLGLRNIANLKDYDGLRIAQLLPDIVLLDFRGCPSISDNATRHLEKFDKHRTVTLIYDDNIHDKQIHRKWPQFKPSIERSPVKVCKGIDFMQHCFFRNFNRLPYLMLSREVEE